MTITYGSRGGGGAGRDRDGDDRRADLAVPGALDRGRRVHESRRLAVDHGQRRERLGNDDGVDRATSRPRRPDGRSRSPTPRRGRHGRAARSRSTAPAGWSAPSTTATDPGYTTASTGTVSAAGQTITVSGVTLAGGATMTIVYGDTGGGGPGATAGATTGAQTWQAQEQLDARRRAREPRRVALDHRVRGRWLRHGRRRRVSGCLRRPDRADRHAHLHGGGGRDAERLPDGRCAYGLDGPRDVAGPGYTTHVRR